MKEREPRRKASAGSVRADEQHDYHRTISLCIFEHMARSLYFSGLLMETIEKQKEYEIELKIAKMRGDSEMIKQCEADLAIIERAYQVTAMLDFDDSVQ